MSVEAYRSEKSRHIVLRQSGGDALPEVLIDKLREEGVACGWLRASGVLADVELRAYDARLAGLGPARRIAGPVQALSIEGAIGLVAGAPSCSLRALLAREGEGGLEVIGGEIQSARAVALEIFVTSLDDLAMARGPDEAGGVWLLGDRGGAPSPSLPQPGGPTPARAGWSTALAATEASERPPRALQAPAPSPGAGRMPQRPARPVVDLDSPVPNVGDVVEHFAFGRCDVVKSDGERLHLRVHKDGRLKEIALEMLRVTPLDEDARPPGEDGPRRFKLDRRM